MIPLVRGMNRGQCRTIEEQREPDVDRRGARGGDRAASGWPGHRRQDPFNKLHFNTCFAEIEALFQRAGYHRQLDVVGYQGLMYALYDPGRWEAVDVLRWLKEFTEAAARAQSIPA